MTLDLPAAPIWQDDALCRKFDRNIFFPGPGENHLAVQATQLCGWCPIRERCLEWALDIEREQGAMPGIYGGTTEVQRRKLRKERACRQCGATFAIDRPHPNFRYCSEACRHEAHLEQRRVGAA